MQTQSGKHSLYPLKGSDPISILVFRSVAVWVAFALAFSPIAPIGGYAQTFEERDCQRNGGVWNGTSCDMPTPEEQCTLDGGTWDGISCVTPPTPEEQCTLDGGTWDGISCVTPPTPEEQCALDGG